MGAAAQLPQAFYFEEGPSGLHGNLTRFRSLAAPQGAF
jgi:hypothetical protein